MGSVLKVCLSFVAFCQQNIVYNGHISTGLLGGQVSYNRRLYMLDQVKWTVQIQEAC